MCLILGLNKSLRGTLLTERVARKSAGTLAGLLCFMSRRSGGMCLILALSQELERLHNLRLPRRGGSVRAKVCFGEVVCDERKSTALKLCGLEDGGWGRGATQQTVMGDGIGGAGLKPSFTG